MCWLSTDPTEEGLILHQGTVAAACNLLKKIHCSILLQNLSYQDGMKNTWHLIMVKITLLLSSCNSIEIASLSKEFVGENMAHNSHHQPCPMTRLLILLEAYDSSERCWTFLHPEVNFQLFDQLRCPIFNLDGYRQMKSHFENWGSWRRITEQANCAGLNRKAAAMLFYQTCGIYSLSCLLYSTFPKFCLSFRQF